MYYFLHKERQLKRPSITFLLFATAFLFIFINISYSEENFLSKEDFLLGAFQENVPKKKSLFFKNEVKVISKKIMGHKYKKIRFKYWIHEARTAWILERIGKVRPITAGFVVDNCKIASVHVLVYRESHGWEIKYPFFRDQFSGMFLVADYKLNRKVDGITGATLSVDSMRKMAQLALSLHNLLPETKCS